MKFIVKLFPEIIMKSSSVRKRFVQVLANNIRTILKAEDETVAVVRHWDFIEVRSKDANKREVLLDNLQRICGIHHILEVQESSFVDLHDIFLQTLNAVGQSLHNKTFCVRAKRRGKHDFNSVDIMQYVGGGLNQQIASAKVQLKNPDITVWLEIDEDKMRLVKARYEGLGGFPMSTQEDVLSLISGGFDSAVASFEFMRRGSRVHFIFFNLGGHVHTLGTKQMAYALWQRYSASHKVKFITVDFSDIVAEILTKIDDGQMGVVLKRMMVRVASQIAKRLNIQALVTGEALGQVASQTLTNLSMIDKASDTLILRPLITADKPQIMQMAQKIGVADIAKSMPEFCGVISKSPTVKAIEHKLLATESNFDFALLDKAIMMAAHTDIRQIIQAPLQARAIETTDIVEAGQVLIDIRAPDEVDDNPLVLDGVEILTIPFYQLNSRFASLAQDKTYLLYCQRGVMSQLQVLYLADKGFKNIKIWKAH